MQQTAELVESITNAGRLLALVVSGRFREPGIHFFTPAEFSQQLAYMEHPAGKLIAPHVHNAVPREVQYTQEVLFIRKGLLRVDFYDHARTYLRSRVLEAGDVVLLIEGGHGFEVMEDVEMIEVKQGPYTGEQDKTRFKGISRAQVKLLSGMPDGGGE
ncbi:MAG: cupin domain-containing protein [Methylocella sp.]